MDKVIEEQRDRLLDAAVPAQQALIRRAVEVLKHLTLVERLEPFLTTVAYAELD
jgi:hypothetical protein